MHLVSNSHSGMCSQISIQFCAAEAHVILLQVLGAVFRYTQTSVGFGIPKTIFGIGHVTFKLALRGIFTVAHLIPSSHTLLAEKYS